MGDYQIWLGLIGVALSFVACGLYLRSMLWGGTKPHPFTWFLITLVDGTVFIAQVLHGGGPGAWPVGVGAALSGLIFLLALKYGERRITRVDWICLALALAGIAAWIITDNALLAVLFACVADIFAKAPTFRKAYVRPNEESTTVWIVDIVLYALSVAALSTTTWTTALFPTEIVIIDAVLVVMIFIRRRQMKQTT